MEGPLFAVLVFSWYVRIMDGDDFVGLHVRPFFGSVDLDLDLWVQRSRHRGTESSAIELLKQNTHNIKSHSDMYIVISDVFAFALST